MSRFQRPVRPSIAKDPVFKFEMKGEEDLDHTIMDLERQMLELLVENLELKQARDRLKNEMEGIYRKLTPAHLTTGQNLQCSSLILDQDNGNVFLDFDTKKFPGEEKLIGGVEEQLGNSIRSQWRVLKKHIERLQAQGSRPLGHRRDPGLSSTDHDKEIAKLKEELREAKMKLAARPRGTKGQEQEVQELRHELAESRKAAQSRDLELEQLRREVVESRQIAQNRLMELEKLRQEMAKCQQEVGSKDQELAALKQAAAERWSPELEAMRKEIAENRELICQQQQLLQEQLSNSSSYELPTPIRGSYFLEEQLRLQEDQEVFEEQKRIFQEERRNFTEAAIRLGHEKKRFEEERGLLAKYSFLNSSSAVLEKEPSPWKRSYSCDSHGPDVHSLLDPVLLLKPSRTPLARKKTPGASTPKLFSERRIKGTPSMAEQYRVLKLTPDQRRLSTAATELRDYQSCHTPCANYRKTPAWEKPVPNAVFSPEPDALPEYVLCASTVFSPHQRHSSTVETTPRSVSKSETSMEDTGHPSTAELYRVLGLTGQSSWLDDRSSTGDSKHSLDTTHRVASSSSSSSRRGSLTYTLLEDKSQTGYRTNGNTPPKDPYSEICSNLLSRFLDTSF